MMKIVKYVGIVFGALALTATGLSSASAAEPPESESDVVSPYGLCNGGVPDLSVTNVNRAYAPGSYRLPGSPGANLTIDVGTSSTVSGSMSLSTTVEAGAIFASASVTAGIELSASETSTATYSVNATIPDEGGYIELGSEGRSFNWSATTYNSNCVVTNQESGTGTGATSTPYGYLSWVGFV
ncbi:hypothetical protein ACT3TS_17735 [Specibacter sp. AOP5-B1-6]|uniref:hypothetical protein n=1 Tax=Specibacter sp. AOP5-B1-6 TaxID=3457653 RepID=UPI003FB6EED2